MGYFRVVDAKASRQRSQRNFAGIGFAAGGVLALISAFLDVLSGHDLVAAFARSAIGMGCLGSALTQLGEAPSAPTARRIYWAVAMLFPVSIIVIATWLVRR